MHHLTMVSANKLLRYKKGKQLLVESIQYFNLMINFYNRIDYIIKISIFFFKSQ